MMSPNLVGLYIHLANIFFSGEGVLGGPVTRIFAIFSVLLATCAGASQDGSSEHMSALIDEFTHEQISAFCQRPEPKSEVYIGAGWVISDVYGETEEDKYSTRVKSRVEHASWGYIAHLNFVDHVVSATPESLAKEGSTKVLVTYLEKRRVYVLPVYQEGKKSPKLYRWLVRVPGGTLHIVSTDPLEALVALEPESYGQICGLLPQ